MLTELLFLQLLLLARHRSEVYSINSNIINILSKWQRMKAMMEVLELEKGTVIMMIGSCEAKWPAKNIWTPKRVDGFIRDDSITQLKVAKAALEEKTKEKEKPSFEYSGKLAVETNKVRGVALLFTEPPEARKPTVKWRLNVFKEGDPLKESLYIHRQSCYLFGRDRRVADFPTDHPFCSKQHAVIQYRLIQKVEADDTPSTKVRPYLMDLGSIHGTFLNGERIDPQRYYELFEKDAVKFGGNSSLEYILLHEHSTG